MIYSHIDHKVCDALRGDKRNKTTLYCSACGAGTPVKKVETPEKDISGFPRCTKWPLVVVPRLIMKRKRRLKTFALLEAFHDVRLLSLTAIKGSKSQHWFIWRVLSPSGPFQALTKITEKDQQDQ